MSQTTFAYGALLLAILSEVIGSAFLQMSQQFSRLLPTGLMVVFYILAFFLLSQALRGIPLGVAYALWAGLGIVLTALVSVIIFRQTLDVPALIGMALIVSGAAVMQLFSNATTH